MKRYNSIGYRWILIGFCLPILLFCLSYGVVYSYFTASTKEASGDITTGVIKISFTDDSAITVSSSNVELNATRLVPGDTIKISGQVKNAGTVSMFALLDVTISVEGDNDIHYYYTATGTRMVASNGEYTTGSTKIDSNDTSPFTIEYELSGSVYDNDYQGKAVSVNVVARAIQYAHIEDAVEATNEIISSI